MTQEEEEFIQKLEDIFYFIKGFALRFVLVGMPVGVTIYELIKVW